MKFWTAISRLAWGFYLLLTSLYCLLAFLPYTYYALIKAPAYAWMPWFVHHHVALYWVALVSVVAADYRSQSRGSRLLYAAFAAAGLALAIWPFMPSLASNRAAYLWSIAALLPLLAFSLAEILRDISLASRQPEPASPLAYSSGIAVAVAIALLSSLSVQLRAWQDSKSPAFHFGDGEILFWSLLSHGLVAVIAVSVLNLVRMGSGRTASPRAVNLLLVGSLVCAGVWAGLVRFLGNALSFEGMPAYLYAAALSLSLTLFGTSLVLPYVLQPQPALPSARRKLWLVAVAIALCAAVLATPSLIRGGDWNGAVQGTLTLVFWVGLSLCAFALRPRVSRRYAVATILGVVILSGFTYKALQASAIFWARPLGSTDDEIARKMEAYAVRDASFQFAHHLLGNGRTLPCGDLCRILRQYTDVRDARARDINLVADLKPATSPAPNIFIFVIDSLRPDYLGAYNPRVDFTPNLDALARNSVVLHNVYTQYAGTTLSEPAIWAGAMLLHAHYLQPFARVNSLEKLAHADGHQVMVSYDTVLSQLLTDGPDLIKLDTDKTLWNRYEVCSTVQQAETALDARADRHRPVLFYAQPMNVHQFANNDNPPRTSENWTMREGLNNRIAYEVHQVDACLGGFVAYLKSRGEYDNSIIVITSDHGDATGEFGRFSHSTLLYPEIMRVPLIVHLPPAMRQSVVYDDSRVSTLTDLAPSLYYLLGHRPIERNPMYGRPLFAASRDELESYPRSDVFFASDVRAAYGILADNGRFFYATYDSPAESYLYDLAADPNGERNIVTDQLKRQYDQRIIEDLHAVADFYGYKPGVGSLLAAAH